MIGGKRVSIPGFHRQLTIVRRQPRVRYADVILSRVIPFHINFPLSPKDIAGANAAGWSSILVRTGVYHPADGPPTHKPTYEAENVETAVHWAIEREIAQTA